MKNMPLKFSRHIFKQDIYENAYFSDSLLNLYCEQANFSETRDLDF
jgi:hypothetical protein